VAPIRPSATKCRYCKEVLSAGWGTSEPDSALSPAPSPVPERHPSTHAAGGHPSEQPTRAGNLIRAPLDTPAPRHERSGLIALLVLLPLWGASLILEGGTTVSRALGLVVVGLPFLAFVRKPWAHSVLVSTLGVLAVQFAAFYAIISAQAAFTSEQRDATSSAIPLSIALFSWLVYFWRRRWWFGVQMPLPVPERSPRAGAALVFVAAVLFALTIDISVFAFVLWQNY